LEQWSANPRTVGASADCLHSGQSCHAGPTRQTVKTVSADHHWWRHTQHLSGGLVNTARLLPPTTDPRCRLKVALTVPLPIQNPFVF
jgi:hypothetical protein